ncbi:MAG: methyltransferase domain-containing protein [Rickettsiales bacterium]
MSLESYYKDHWVTIEDERLDRYEVMFQWSPAFERLLEPARIQPGQTVGDLGCGPGFLSEQLLQRVGPSGHVHAFDVNADFIDRTRARATKAGLADRLTLHHLKDGDIPLASGVLDCIIAKNVMVYVDDPRATFAEFRRVLKPGGKAHAIDSDFGMVAIDPVPPDDWRALMDAAMHAFRTPHIGRKLYGFARSAGFREVDVQILASPDTKGRLLNFAQNIAGYAREAGSFEESAIQAILDTATQALEDGTYFAVNPQFVVTATL